MYSNKILLKLKDLVNLQTRGVHLTKAVNNEGLLGKVFGKQGEKATQAHSVLLADQEILYELEIHSVKPDKAEDYEKYCTENIPNILAKNSKLKLTGSWKSELGVQDQYVHLWQYKNYTDFSEMRDELNKEEDCKNFRKKIASYVNHRERQICLSFTFWGQPAARSKNHIYEMRSYALKPGSLIEWGNNWSRGIRNRLDYRVAGMFTQVGPIYHVHHIWAYESLIARKASREKMWEKPGWDECVAYTVPLIREMDSKIMVAMPYSQMK